MYWIVLVTVDIEDGEIHISLQKMSKGETWMSALKGHVGLDPFTEEKVKKQMMLERFQEEVCHYY